MCAFAEFKTIAFMFSQRLSGVIDSSACSNALNMFEVSIEAVGGMLCISSRKGGGGVLLV